MTIRLALGVAYDGAGFHGFAAQPQQKTVAGVLVEALRTVLGHDLELTCAGRTDSGVHALAQVVHFDVDGGALTDRFGDLGVGTELPLLARSLTSVCGEGIDVWRAQVVSPSFDARHSALARRYRYDLEIGLRADPLRRHTVWHLEHEPDLAVLRLASDPLIGEHDFAAFCRRPPDRPTGPITRRVTTADWHYESDGILRFEIEAKAFCHQMVRSIVGALVAAGNGRIRPNDIAGFLRSGRRDGAPTLAPPQGLCLVAVRYPEEFGGTWA